MNPPFAPYDASIDFSPIYDSDGNIIGQSMLPNLVTLPPGDVAPGSVPIFNRGGQIIGWTTPPVRPPGVPVDAVPIFVEGEGLVGWGRPPLTLRVPGNTQQLPAPRPKDSPPVIKVYPRPERPGPPPPKRNVFPLRPPPPVPKDIFGRDRPPPRGGNLGAGIAAWGEFIERNLQQILESIPGNFGRCQSATAQLTSMWFDAGVKLAPVLASLAANIDYATWAVDNCVGPSSAVDCGKSWSDAIKGMQAALGVVDSRFTEAKASWSRWAHVECSGVLVVIPPLWDSILKDNAARVDLLVNDSVANLAGWDSYLDNLQAECCGQKVRSDTGVIGGGNEGPVPELEVVAQAEPPVAAEPPFVNLPPQEDGTPTPPEVEIPPAYEPELAIGPPPHEEDIPVPQQALPPAAVQVATIGDGSAQRSIIRLIAVQFAAPIIFPDVLNAFQLVRTGPGEPTGNVRLSADIGGTPDAPLVTLTFSGQFSEYDSLIDGYYTLVVRGDQIVGPGGANPPGEYRIDFFRLFGDGSGSGFIGALDAAAVNQLFFNGPSASAFADRIATYDLDGDGVISQFDYTRFRQTYLGGGTLS